MRLEVYLLLCFSVLLLTSSESRADPSCACAPYGSCDFRNYFRTSLLNQQNVAFGKTAKMSSFFMRPAIKEVSGPACLAVNGNTNTTFRPLSQFPDSPNCIHTGDNDRDPYWEVDLGQHYAIVNITIYWRNLFLQRSDGVRVTVDGQLVHVFKSPVSNPSNVVFGVPVTGETVRLSKTDKKTKHYYLTVCEVEVWGMSCACSDYGSCDFSNQDLKVTSPQKGNVALGKPAKMSSMFTDAPHNEVSGPACLAVNGNRNTTFRPINQFPDSPNCIHTETDDREPYWEVDLGQPYTIASITVYWRDRYVERSYGVNVSVDGQFCHTFQHPVPNPSTITCGTSLTGRTVRLSKVDPSIEHSYFLTVCEVEVIACGPGFFGTDCQGVCPQVCEKNQTCSPVDGTCPQAIATVSPPTLDVTSLTPKVTSLAPSTLDVTGSTPEITSLAPSTPEVTSLTPSSLDVTSSTPEVTCLAPSTPEVTCLEPSTTKVTCLAPSSLDVTSSTPVITSLVPSTPEVTSLTPSSLDVTSSTPEVTCLAPSTPEVTCLEPSTTKVTCLAPSTLDVTSSTLDVTSLTPGVTRLASLTLDVTSSTPEVTSSTPGVTSLAPSTLDVTSSTPGVTRLALSTLDVTRSTPEVTCLAPLTLDVTRMAVIIAGSFLCGCVVTGLCAALVLCFRHPGACRRLTRVQATQSGRHVSPQSGDVSMAEVRELTQASPPGAAQSSGSAEGAAGDERRPHHDGESQEYINARMSQSLEVLIPKKKKNIYKPFPTRWSQHKVVTVPKANSSDDEECEEMI